MRVAADDDLPVGLQPFDNPLADILSVPALVCSARYAPQTEELQPLPDVPHRKPAHGGELVALEIGLMPVDDKDPLPGSGVVQGQSLVGDESIFLHPVVLVALDVVVADDEVQPATPVKLV